MPTLDWIGKKAVLNHHREVPYHLLRYNRSLSAGDLDSENLMVQGDNLIALVRCQSPRGQAFPVGGPNSPA